MKETRNMLKKSKQTVVFASQIHKEREGGSVNTYTIVHRTQEAFDRTSPGRALLRVIPTETNPGKDTGVGCPISSVLMGPEGWGGDSGLP